MYRRIGRAAAVSGIFLITTVSWLAQTLPARPTRTYQGNPAQPLAFATAGGHAATVARFLRSRGIDVTEQSLAPVSQVVLARHGISTVRFEQRISGLPVHGIYAKASFSPRGELIYLVENLLPQFIGTVTPPKITEAQALDAALRRHYPDMRDRPSITQRNGNKTAFQRTSFFRDPPTVTRVAVALGNNSLQTAMLVETWSEQQNLPHLTLVGPAAEILSMEARTANESHSVQSLNRNAFDIASVNR